MSSFRRTRSRELAVKRSRYRRMHETIQAAPELGNFADDAGADVGSLHRRHHEDCLETRRQVAVHQRHLKLVLEIAHCAESSDDERRADLTREVDEQTLELSHLHATIARGCLSNQIDALVGREQRLLRAVVGDSDDEPVDELAAAADEVLVTTRDRIEASGIDGDRSHSVLAAIEGDCGRSVTADIGRFRKELPRIMLDTEYPREWALQPEGRQRSGAVPRVRRISKGDVVIMQREPRSETESIGAMNRRVVGTKQFDVAAEDPQ